MVSESDADSSDSIRPRKIGEMKYKGSRQAVVESQKSDGDGGRQLKVQLVTKKHHSLYDRSREGEKV